MSTLSPCRPIDTADERFVRLLLQGTRIRGLSTALQMSVNQDGTAVGDRRDADRLDG